MNVSPQMIVSSRRMCLVMSLVMRSMYNQVLVIIKEWIILCCLRIELCFLFSPCDFNTDKDKTCHLHLCNKMTKVTFIY